MILLLLYFAVRLIEIRARLEDATRRERSLVHAALLSVGVWPGLNKALQLAPVELRLHPRRSRLGSLGHLRHAHQLTALLAFLAHVESSLA